ncbi:hypothetical protein [Porphyromonas levii]|uniref:hypothetical protein n=1 Tax=Porphyromonas levii TaxID=28114 RepID=UPI00036F3902|nr:hypothetical protein [Porphyromonas levii]
MKKFSLQKKVLASLDYDAMKRIQGGGYCDPSIPMPIDEINQGGKPNIGAGGEIAPNAQLWTSRLLCMTYFETGGCSHKSKSCSTAPICIPF